VLKFREKYFAKKIPGKTGNSARNCLKFAVVIWYHYLLCADRLGPGLPPSLGQAVLYIIYRQFNF